MLPGVAQPFAAPFASLSIASIDSAGTISGHGYGAFNGQVAPAPFNGTIQVNPDCTAISKPSAGIAATDVILEGGDEFKGLLTHFPMGNPVLQGRAKRISRALDATRSAHCSAAKVHGTYAVTYQGDYLVPPPGGPLLFPVPALMIGLASIDRQGQVSGRGTASLAGQATEFEIVSGNIDVQSDCTATVQMSVKSGNLVDEGKIWMVILEGGDELWAIQTESHVAKPVLAGIWKRVSEW
jgi:hypothetical protein